MEYDGIACEVGQGIGNLLQTFSFECQFRYRKIALAVREDRVEHQKFQQVVSSVQD